MRGYLKTTQLDADSGSVDTRATELASRTIEAALADSSDERAWVLVRLAEDLRALGRADVALRALDAAWELRPSEEPRRAIFTCAISAHCDLDQHVVAEVIEREQAARSVDDEFALAALRLYSALSRRPAAGSITRGGPTTSAACTAARSSSTRKAQAPAVPCGPLVNALEEPR